MNITQIIPERLALVTNLAYGSHAPDSTWCAMEAVAYIAGEPWSDHPRCVCPVLGAFARAWNDGLLDDAARNEYLLPLLPRFVGTRGSDALTERRSLMAADWLVRTHTPAWLRLAGLTAHADALAGLPEITSMAHVPSAAMDAAWDAAWDAARDALEPTRLSLQQSARDLLIRMIKATEPAVAEVVR